MSGRALSELLEALRAGDGVDLIRHAVRLVMQALIELEASDVIGAKAYERTDIRVNERNGDRSRLLATQAGDIELKIPKLSHGSFLSKLVGAAPSRSSHPRGQAGPLADGLGEQAHPAQTTAILDYPTMAQLSQVLDASDLPSTRVVEHVEAAPERPADLRELVRQEC